MMTDPIADLLARLRNGAHARHVRVSCPASKQKLAIAEVLRDNGFVGEVRLEESGTRKVLVVGLRYDDDGRPVIAGLRRVSRPGRRVYVGSSGIPKVRSGLGVAVLSTSRGILSDRAAREAKLGGELICEVW
jgi:small subunit ribosomal protein S8